MELNTKQGLTVHRKGKGKEDITFLKSLKAWDALQVQVLQSLEKLKWVVVLCCCLLFFFLHLTLDHQREQTLVAALHTSCVSAGGWHLLMLKTFIKLLLQNIQTFLECFLSLSVCVVKCAYVCDYFYRWCHCKRIQIIDLML